MKKKSPGDLLEAMSAPSFSIITPCLNRVEFIVEAVESVLAQKYPDFEHLIMDGGSTDGTLEVLKRYPHLQIQSGQDRGMYDALNRGLSLAKGEIVGFLNSDDLYAENIFAGVAEKFQMPKVRAVAGGALIFAVLPNGKIDVVSSFSPKSSSLLENSTIGDPYFNAWFFRRSTFDEIQNFDVQYRIVADREYMLRFALSGMYYEIMDNIVYQYRKHADSMTFDITYQKLQRIIDEHILMTTAYLNKGDLSAEARDLIRRLRTRDTSEMAVRSLRKLKFNQLAYYARRGIQYEPLWFLHFTRRLLHINV